MAEVRGVLTRVLGYTESAFKTPGTDGVVLPLTQFGAQPRQPRQQSATLTGKRGASRSAGGNKSVEGPWGYEVAPESVGIVLKHLVGAPTTTGAGPYTHVFQHALTGANVLPPGLTLEQDFGSGVLSGTARILRLLGCRINQGQLSLTPAGFPTMSLDIVGADWLQAATPLDATPTDYGHTGFEASNVTVQIGSVAKNIPLNQLTLTIGNDLDTDKYAISGGGVRAGLGEGQALVTGQINAFLDHEDVINTILSGTDTEMTITISRGTGLGTAGNESLVISIPALVFEVGGAPVQGPRGVRVQASFQAHRNSTAELGVTYTLKNSIASYA